MSDWDKSSVVKNNKPVPAAKVAAISKKGKWEGEDEDEDEPASDWDASSDDEPVKKPVVTSNAAPPKKKGTLKQKLAEKEAAVARVAATDSNEDDAYDSDEVLDPREKARRDKEKELNADLNNAADLLGAAALGGTSSKELDQLISFQPRTKDDFIKLTGMIMEVVINRHQTKPLYPSFVEHFARELAQPLKDVEVRKVASGLTTLSNEKQKEQRDKASGRKKPKAASKPGLGGTKSAGKLDTAIYDEALDDEESFM